MKIDISEKLNKFEESLKSQTEKKKADLYKTLDVDAMEKFTYLDVNVQSFASGIIDLNTSQFLYNRLSNYGKTTLAERLFITKIMAELLQKRMNK